LAAAALIEIDIAISRGHGGDPSGTLSYVVEAFEYER
jgi:hypothetical protein